MPPTEGTADTDPAAVPLPGREAVREWLLRHQIIDAADPLTTTPLPGGVSGVVLDVVAGGRRFVLKQSRRRLDVRDEWFADVRRLVHEGRVGRLLSSVIPGRVPGMILLDTRLPALLMERAPLDWREWRAMLLDPQSEPTPIPDLGSVLATWHSRCRLLPEALDQLGTPGRDYFEQLRLDPFLRVTAERAPQYATHLRRCLSLLRRPGRTLVHGDFSPKNVLLGADGYWLLDFEVAHLGQPVFDVAFLLCHLQLKSVARPAYSARFDEMSADFCRGYVAATDDDLRFGPSELSLVLGCLLLARVYGSSPAAYLTAEQRLEVERRAGLLLAGSLGRDAAGVDENVWPQIQEMIR